MHYRSAEQYLLGAAGGFHRALWTLCNHLTKAATIDSCVQLRYSRSATRAVSRWGIDNCSPICSLQAGALCNPVSSFFFSIVGTTAKTPVPVFDFKITKLLVSIIRLLFPFRYPASRIYLWAGSPKHMDMICSTRLQSLAPLQLISTFVPHAVSATASSVFWHKSAMWYLIHQVTCSLPFPLRFCAFCIAVPFIGVFINQREVLLIAQNWKLSGANWRGYKSTYQQGCNSMSLFRFIHIRIPAKIYCISLSFHKNVIRSFVTTCWINDYYKYKCVRLTRYVISSQLWFVVFKYR